MNTPTQEQIEAALAWSTYDPGQPSIELNAHVVDVMQEFCHEHAIETYTLGACKILAAAYRKSIQQRDTLAEALERWPFIREWLEMSVFVKGYMSAESEFFDGLDKALAALKGEKP